MGKKHFCFFQTAETGNRTPNSGVKGSVANHYPKAPAQLYYWNVQVNECGFNVFVVHTQATKGAETARENGNFLK